MDLHKIIVDLKMQWGFDLCTKEKCRCCVDLSNDFMGPSV